ncbi:hypothetical protein [Xanthomonas citri]|uniref:hypothetical protein n=1 Tax=Xanthomonas citri TaxID=346 RepID=UPI000AC59F4B|nr:hypothetical protein [Xanthomonas citri]QRD58267.1 hypothetical protein H8Z75_23525 [Xanthomonas citri pv. citri]
MKHLKRSSCVLLQRLVARVAIAKEVPVVMRVRQRFQKRLAFSTRLAVLSSVNFFMVDAG